MLTDILRREYIQVNVESENFEDAIVKSLNPLLLNGAVTDKYVEKILEIYRETGPYIVITKSVALPHAPSEFGVKKLALGLTILKEPVVSGHETNDPVKYLFSLSSPDSNQHLIVISQLVQLLSNDEFIEKLSKANDVEIVEGLLREYEGDVENE